MSNTTAIYTPVTRYCKITGQLCELATDLGYCQITACTKKKDKAEEAGNEQ